MPVTGHPPNDSDRPEEELHAEYQTWKAEQEEEVRALAHDFTHDLDVQRAELTHTSQGPALEVTIHPESSLTVNDLAEYAEESPLDEARRFSGPSGSEWVVFY